MKKSKILVGGFAGLVMVFVWVMGGCVSTGCLTFGNSEEAIDVANFTNSSMLQSVSRVTFDGLPKTSPVVSPDGVKLLYCETQRVLNKETSLWTTQSNIIMLRNVNSEAKTPLVTTGNAFTPGWYEDSIRYLFSFSENNTRRIVRSSSAGGGRTNITRNPVASNDEVPVIRNGVILIDTLEGGEWYIYSMLENGSAVTRLGKGHDPEWHPTEPKFLYVKGSPSGIWEMDMATNQETLLYEMPPYNIRRPRFTSDGSHIVFQRGSEQMVGGTVVVTTSGKQSQTKTAGKESRWQLYSITAEGFNESVLTEGNVDCTHPTLDQNNTLFFLSNASGVKSGKWEIYKALVNFE
jgi:dipeptidyl aminopeptidase/acylaminoacyl peptidase